MGFMETKFCEACDEDYDWAAPECPGCVRRRYDEARAEQVAALKKELAKYKQLHDMEVEARKATRDAMAAEAARLIAEVDRLRGLLREALDLADEAIGYTPECFQDKWQLPQTAARLRSALGEEVERARHIRGNPGNVGVPDSGPAKNPGDLQGAWKRRVSPSPTPAHWWQTRATVSMCGRVTSDKGSWVVADYFTRCALCNRHFKQSAAMMRKLGIP